MRGRGAARPRAATGLSVARTAWGSALLFAPGAVVADLPHERIDRSARVVARILGARQIAEAAFIGRRRSRALILTGAAIDTIHALTFGALALLRPDRRALALTNVATASVFAISGVVESRRVPSPTERAGRAVPSPSGTRPLAA